MLRKYLKFAIYLIVIAGYSLSFAGSYDDFFSAVRRDDSRTVESLLARGFDPNTVDPSLQPALFTAILDNSFNVAEVLARHPDTKVGLLNEKDESVLMLAALKGLNGVCTLLIEREADVNKPGWTALHYAATGGHVKTIQLLLEHSAYIDAASPNGSTPLMMAALYGYGSAVRELLDAGADPVVKNSLGLDAVDFAIRGKSEEALDLILKAVGQR
jgi:ankyrin repeat protein